jgi:hypothetical protein
VESERHERRGRLMPSRLDARLRRLEARRPPVAAPPSTPPEPPPGWCEEVLRLLRDYGYLDDTLRSWGLTETDIAAVYASIEETPTDALTP